MNLDNQFKKVVSKSYDNVRIDYWLKKNFPNISYTVICKLLRKGSIRLNGLRIRQSKKIKTNDIVKIPQFLITSSNQEFKKIIPYLIKKKIYDWVKFINDDFIVLDKPSGVAVQGGSKIKYSLDDMLSAFENNKKIKPKLVHRIDKDTSGLLIVSRNLESAKFFTKLFKDIKIFKTYLAIINGKFDIEKGIINFPIKTKKKEFDAITFFKIIHESNEHSLIALSPKTGRKNQIRKHLLRLNRPILGDEKFSIFKNRNSNIFDKKQNLNLNAYKLSFEDMNGKFWEFKSNLTQQMRDNLKKMNFNYLKLERDFFINIKNWKNINEI